MKQCFNNYINQNNKLQRSEIMKTSCKDCERRHVGCHANCESYKAYQAENERLKQLRFIDKQKNIYTGYGIYAMNIYPTVCERRGYEN